ncbi:MAG TPA: FAD-binding and (Fe-S)-binding domain-containing protein [Bryobacteraceae bacterium]|nr:FAD-binding and (Fe-S)-binding domain-containing protein [Bryobacteraceae bacterium]
MLLDPYRELHRSLVRSIPADRLFHDELRTLAYGTDASFYRLIPKLVVRVESEREVRDVLDACRRASVPLTFRAAGTSLSGQAISDSVLVQLATAWNNIEIEPGGARVSADPAVIGSRLNRALAPYGRKLGPDPASINSAMLGGIAANNASGMCCGTAQNSYRTLASMRIVLAGGAVLDTGDPESCRGFRESHAEHLARLSGLAARACANAELAARIRRKYRMKNTTGYSLNALVDFTDPLDILQHLMVGSEGTLGFISRITYQTVPELLARASAMLFFPDVRTACQATALLRKCPVSAVEIMDRASLRSVEGKPGMPDFLGELGAEVTALLVETGAATSAELHAQIEVSMRALAGLPLVRHIPFTEDPAQTALLWNVRKGLFPSVGAVRKIGTTVIIEDVAFPIERLADAATDLQALFRRHGYDEAIIFGHALEGNLHFVFTQDFGSDSEVARYGRFIHELTELVAGAYDGSLKAEHGTGRNMAPFVEREWGAEAYGLMREIKDIFDPGGILNPGVILNTDAEAHLKNLKPLPEANPLVDRCIECGFCEINCPSRNLTLTPRQRIVSWREISRLERTGGDAARLAELKRLYAYQGNETCAVDGLCATSCPVAIDTGKLTKELRLRENSPAATRIAGWVADHMEAATAGLRTILGAVDLAHACLGTTLMGALAGAARKLSGSRLPAWNPYLPKRADPHPRPPAARPGSLRVVYFPSCIARAMGAARGAPARDPQTVRTVALLAKAGCEVVYPEGIDALCCGMAFASKGFAAQGERKLAELIGALTKASRAGRDPVLFDTSPCLHRVKEALGAADGIEVFEIAGFIERYLADRLEFHKTDRTVALHVPCSSRKLGLDAALKAVAERCAARVVMPEDVGCCGFAGDRGFTHPELTASALRDLRAALPPGCTAGYSTSRACEIGLSQHGGVPYQSLVYLVDECTTPHESRRD